MTSGLTSNQALQSTDLEDSTKAGAASWVNSIVLPRGLKWLDSDYFGVGVESVKSLPAQTNLSRWIPFLILHLLALPAFFMPVSPLAIGVCVFLYSIRMFAITAFFHRYFAHKCFKTSRLAQFVFAFWGGLAVQRGALWWAAHHRHHHKNSDKVGDVHSPVMRGFIWSHIGWITADCNMPTRYELIPDLTRYPELVFLNRFDWIPAAVLIITLYASGCLLQTYCPALHTSGLELLLWGFFVSTVVLFHCVCSINSLSHIFGNQRYETDDDSKNNFLLALITFGEGWHNNHHRYQSAARQGFYWWEVDLTYYVLKLFSLTGIIWQLRPVPDEAYTKSQDRKV